MFKKYINLWKKDISGSIMKWKINYKGFTLAELLVVLCIIGILVLLALPSLMPLISKAKETEAQINLKHIFTLEKTYFYEYSKYTNNLSELRYETNKSVLEGGNANYRIEVISLSPNTFKVRATSVVDFNGNGIYNQWEIDQDQKLIETVPD